MISVLDSFLVKVVTQIFNPILQLLIAVSFLVFVWGVFTFIKNAGDAAAREKGQKTILWGLVGLAIMFGAYGIINVVTSTFNLAPVKSLQSS